MAPQAHAADTGLALTRHRADGRPHIVMLLSAPACRNTYHSPKPELAAIVGVCTHMGFIPSLKKQNAAGTGSLGSDWPDVFFCPCHSSKFDLAGHVFKNVPTPTDLDVPLCLSVTNDRARRRFGQQHARSRASPARPRNCACFQRPPASTVSTRGTTAKLYGAGGEAVNHSSVRLFHGSPVRSARRSRFLMLKINCQMMSAIPARITRASMTKVTMDPMVNRSGARVDSTQEVDGDPADAYKSRPPRPAPRRPARDDLSPGSYLA